VNRAELPATFHRREHDLGRGGRRESWWRPDITFKDAGRVGVWTKADSVTLFDDFSYSGS
jgi:hypothetical protein